MKTNRTFDQFRLPKSLLKGLAQLNFKTPFPIQEKAIPKILQGKDVLGIAKTGSGKTASYTLPILEKIDQLGKPENRHIQGLSLIHI